MDVNTFLAFDQSLLLFLNGSNSIFMENLIIVLTSGWTWIPLYLSLLYVVVKNNETMGQILLIIGCAAFCILLSGGVSDFIVKPFFARERPCNDLAFKGCISLANNFRATGYSFFSSHAANTFSLAIFFILLIRSRVLSVSLILWSFTNCYTRLYLGVHYPSDIAVGLIWGGVSGYCAYKLYHCMYGKIAPQITYVSTQYTVSGYDIRDIDVVIFTIIVTLLYAVIRSVIIYI